MMIKILAKTCLILAGFAATSLSAHAHEFRNKKAGWVPPVPKVDLSRGHIVRPFCDGKYEAVAGDLHHLGFNSYIDLYRFNIGLPKLTPANENTLPKVWGEPAYGHHTRGETRLRDALLLLERSQTHLSPEAIYDYLATLNVNTRSGETLDGWLNTDVPDDHNSAGCNIYPTVNWRRNGCGSAATITSKQTAFDWLMTAHQMENARVAWLSKANAWPDQVSNIFSHIDKQSQERPGVNIWMTQYHHHKLFEHTIPADIANRAQEAVSRIISCEARPEEYSIIAVGDLGLPRDYLPKGLAESRTRRDIHTLTYNTMKQGNGLDAAYHAQLRMLAGQLEEKSWATSFLFLSAPDVAAAVEIYQESLAQEEQNPRYNSRFYGRSTSSVKSLIFSLPTEDIPNDLMRFSHALSEDKIGLVDRLENEVFSAARVIRQDAKAEMQNRLSSYQKNSYAASLVEDTKRKLEFEVEKIAQLDALEASNLPIKVKAALLAILTETSHVFDWHNSRKPRNIYPEQSRTDFLDIYIRHKLFPGIIYSPPVRGYPSHRSPLRYMNEKYTPSAVTSLPSLRKNDGTSENGLAAIVDWEKLDAFAGDKKLTRTMAINIFEWLDSASPEEQRANAKLLAPALYAIIRIARYEEAGVYKGALVQKHAHKYLQRHYGQTAYAKNTPHWWPSRRRGHVPF